MPGKGPNGGRRTVAALVATSLAGAVVAAAVLEAGPGSAAEAAKPAGRGGGERVPRKLRKLPNVILVVSDDQTAADYNQRTMPFTTELMADGGTTFTDAIATTPNCCPSRASILTGQYAHNHGVLSNRLGYEALRAKANTLPVWLKRKGYATAHVGKYLNGYEAFVKRKTQKPPGWREWHTTLGNRYYDYPFVSGGRVLRKGSREKSYLGRVITRKAVKMVRRHVRGPRPLYMQVDYYAPHVQLPGSDSTCAAAARPDPDDVGLFADEPLPRPPSFNEADVEDKPTFIRRLPLLDSEQIAAAERRYRCALASLRSIDRGIERIVSALESRGELGKTAIIFMSDNGFFYGQHRLPNEKQQAFEEAIQIPLAARWPRRLGDAPGVISAPVANIDIAPTVLRLAKARPCRSRKRCRRMDGRSLTPLAKGKTSAWPDGRVLGIEFDISKSNANRGSTCAFDGIRTPIDVYVEHERVVSDPEEKLCEPTNEAEQYQLRRAREYGPLAPDPFQIRNLTAPPSIVPEAALPRVAARRAELRALLNRTRDCAGLSGRDRRPRSGHFCE